MPSGLSQSHQEIAGQFQRELLQLICLGSGGQHVQRPPPRGMERPIGLQCPCNSFTRQEVRGASDSTNQRIENNALVSNSVTTGGARRVVYLVVSYSPVRGSAKDTRLRIQLDRQANMVQTAGGSLEEGAARKDDDMSNKPHGCGCTSYVCSTTRSRQRWCSRRRSTPTTAVCPRCPVAG